MVARVQRIWTGRESQTTGDPAGNARDRRRVRRQAERYWAEQRRLIGLICSEPVAPGDFVVVGVDEMVHMSQAEVAAMARVNGQAFGE